MMTQTSRVERFGKWLLGGSFLLFSGVMLSAQTWPSGPTYLDQGTKWTPAERSKFYSTDQGSELINFAWLRALTQPDGTLFMADGLVRFGYLANPSSALGLPVGFTTHKDKDGTYAGMTCAACHTREIEANGTIYRIDGGPALSDFQAFLTALDEAVGRTLSDEPTFQAFAAKVLGPGATPLQKANLRTGVAAWYNRMHVFFQRALPDQPWGIGRLDAISMIFNRLSGLDVAPTADGIIPANIYKADAPARYPFIWNAPRQDHTQWPGFASNGDSLLALARNLGEVYGVFARYHPVPGVLGIDHLKGNSVDFDNLDRLETMVREIGSPKYPWPSKLGPDEEARAVAHGQGLFLAKCAACHAQTAGQIRFVPLSTTWKTPILDVQTDTRQYTLLVRLADTGTLKGAIDGLGSHLDANDRQMNMLVAAVIGTLGERVLTGKLPHSAVISTLDGSWISNLAAAKGQPKLSPMDELNIAYDKKAPDGPNKFEARVLYGIWAVAPYLHNGSVPTLAELLKPDSQRVTSFALGRRYDPDAVGLAADQGGNAPVRHLTGCDDRGSGNSNCGHNYGTDLSVADRADLLEFLKTL